MRGKSVLITGASLGIGAQTAKAFAREGQGQLLFGVRGFSQALAQELNKVKVYVVNPGMTATRMTGFRGDPPEKVAEVILKTAKGQLGHGNGDDINVWKY